MSARVHDAAPVPPEVSHAVVLRIAMPVALSSLSTPMVGAVDTAVIGQLGDPALMGGVAAASILASIVLLPFNFLGKVTTGLAAQAVGSGDGGEVLATVLRSVGLALCIGLAILLCQFLVARIGFWALGIDGAVRDAAATYFLIRIWSAPFVLTNYAVLGWLFGRGAIAQGFLLQLFLNGVNIVLTIVLVLHFEWGVAGAAAAAVTAEVATALIGGALVAAAFRRGPRGFVVADRPRLRRLIGMNADMIVRTLVIFLVMAFLTREGAALGTVTLAANAILLNLILLSSALMNGFAVAAQQLGGRAIGGNEHETFHGVVRLTWRWCLAGAAAISACYFALREPILAVMTADAAVREAARAFYPYGALAPVVGALAYHMDGVFVGATWSRAMRDMMLLAALAFVAAWLALRPLGNHGLWLAFLTFLAARGLTLRWRLTHLAPRRTDVT